MINDEEIEIVLEIITDKNLSWKKHNLHKL